MPLQIHRLTLYKRKPQVSKGHKTDDSVSETALPNDERCQPTPTFEVKRLDCYINWMGSRKYRPMNTTFATMPPDPAHISRSFKTWSTPPSDRWRNYALLLIRIVSSYDKPTFRYITNNPYVILVCKDVIKYWAGINWEADRVEISSKVFVTYFQRFCEYKSALERADDKRTASENNLLLAVSLIIDSVFQDFAETLKELSDLLSKAEINFDLLYALFVPDSLVVSSCASTNLPVLYNLSPFGWDGFVNLLEGKSIDIANGGHWVGEVKTTIRFTPFSGNIPIINLPAYPIEFHPDQVKLREQVIQRGRTWLNLMGMHHKQYNGPAEAVSGIIRHDNIKSRIMIDRANFRRCNPDYHLPQPGGLFKPQLSDEQLLLTPTVAYGFSFSNNTWYVLNVELVKDVQWNNEPFKHLVMHPEKKRLLQSVVEGHNKGVGPDSFMSGKRKGLIINLSGPPGVGKSLTAEAMSEHLRKPLYVTRSGELGTNPDTVESNLRTICHLATAWRANILIDEADPFVEKRTNLKLKKNTMDVVFLRHVEYYHGILFLSTSRLAVFDDAFLSRVPISIHSVELKEDPENNREVQQGGRGDNH